MRTVHYGPQHRRNSGYVRRFVPGQQPRQPHELAVPVEHLARSVARGLVPRRSVLAPTLELQSVITSQVRRHSGQTKQNML